MKLLKGRLSTDLHVKDMDQHQYLHFNYSHPDHTKRSIIYSQALRLAKICTFENDFLQHKVEMKSWFQRRGYPEDVISTEMKKMNFNVIPVNLVIKAKVRRLLITLLGNKVICFT